MSSLVLQGRPDNLRAPIGATVESDVFYIADRLKEISRSLILYALDPPVSFNGKTYTFAVGEKCADGVERLVARYEALDARILEHVQYLLHVPFEKRFAEAERQEREHEAAARQQELDELYEVMGRPMWTDLERTGFIQRAVSYPKRGVKPK